MSDQAENEVVTPEAEIEQPEELQEQVTAEESTEVEPVEEEVVITLGDDSPSSEAEEPEKAPEWVRELRKQHREAQKRIKELEAERVQPKQEAPVLGAKPTLESCDYDPEAFEQKLTEWHEKKRAVEAAEARKQKEAEAQQQEWQAKVKAYNEAKSKLKVPDMEDAQEAVELALSTQQQGVILHIAESPEMVVYALGKNPNRLKEIAAIQDPLKLAGAIAKLEAKELKVNKRTPPPPPEKVVKSSAPIAGGVDKRLETLREEAMKSGDFSKVIAYKKSLKS